MEKGEKEMRIGRLVFLMLTMVLFAVMVHADTIVQSFGSELWGDTFNYTVLGFDTSLGTLNSVSIDLSADVAGDWNVENAGPGNMHTEGSIYGTSTVGYIAGIFSNDVTAYDDDAWDTTIGPGSSIGGSLADTTSTTDTYIVGLSNFYNDWSVSMSNESEYSDFNVPATAATLNLVHGDGDVMVTYNYTPVTDPSSVLALFAGSAGLFGFIKRRRS
jgi:hypothetical protein